RHEKGNNGCRAMGCTPTFASIRSTMGVKVDPRSDAPSEDETFAGRSIQHARLGHLCCCCRCRCHAVWRGACWGLGFRLLREEDPAGAGRTLLQVPQRPVEETKGWAAS